MYFLYSLSVVAPITCMLPLERAGFNMLPAFIELSCSMPPTILCSSSIARIMLEYAAHSSITPFILASNWPLNWVPATIAVMSRRYTCLFASFCGTSPDAIWSARAFNTAVLPTPGSPIKAGLFLLRLFSICINLSNSFSRPITLSSLPSLASLVKLVPYVSKYLSFLFSFFSLILTLDLAGSLSSSSSDSSWVNGNMFGIESGSIPGIPSGPNPLNILESLSISILENNFSNCLESPAISSGDMFSKGLAVGSNVLIPRFFAHSAQRPIISFFFPSGPLSSILFMYITATFFLQSEHNIM